MSHLIVTVAALQIGWFGISPGTFPWTEWDLRDLPALKSIYVIENDRFGPFILPADKLAIAHLIGSSLASVDVRNSVADLARPKVARYQDSYQFRTGTVFDEIFIDCDDALCDPLRCAGWDYLIHWMRLKAEKYSPAKLSRNWNAARKNRDLVAGWNTKDDGFPFTVDPLIWHFDSDVIPQNILPTSVATEASRPTVRFDQSGRMHALAAGLLEYRQ